MKANSIAPLLLALVALIALVAVAAATALPDAPAAAAPQASYVRICKDRRGMRDRRACRGKADPERSTVAAAF